MTEEQKGCRKGTKGCKEQLIIVILSHVQKKNRKLFCGQIDYPNAHDFTRLVNQTIEAGHPILINFFKTETEMDNCNQSNSRSVYYNSIDQN